MGGQDVGKLVVQLDTLRAARVMVMVMVMVTNGGACLWLLAMLWFGGSVVRCFGGSEIRMVGGPWSEVRVGGQRVQCKWKRGEPHPFLLTYQPPTNTTVPGVTTPT